MKVYAKKKNSDFFLSQLTLGTFKLVYNTDFQGFDTTQQIRSPLSHMPNFSSLLGHQITNEAKDMTQSLAVQFL